MIGRRRPGWAAASIGVRRQLGEAVARRIFDPPGPAVDFTRPRGDPGLYGPESVTWRVHANPISLAVGGVAAVVLELAEPRVRTGVWEHSAFRRDPLGRMKRTGDAAMVTTFGPTDAALARIERVNRLHARVSGVTPEGTPYHALDSELLAWVHLTAAYGFLKSYRRYVDPGLSRVDQDRYYAEGAKVAHLMGAVDAPVSASDAEARLDVMRCSLRRHPIIHEFLSIVRRTAPLGIAGRALQPLLVEASLNLLPEWVRSDLGLDTRPLMSAAADTVLRRLAIAAQWAPSPIPQQAYARMARSDRSRC